MILRNETLKRIAPAERAKMGKAGLLASECHDIAVAKCERELQGQLVNLLKLKGVNFPMPQKFGVKTTVPKGTPDILFTYRGISCAWEVKMPTGKLSPDQVDAIKDLTADGCQCVVIRSYDEGLKELARLEGLAAPADPNTLESRNKSLPLFVTTIHPADEASGK